ncbi:hypothetical protein RB597_009064 [Gaeumannomyces tritici]
MSSRGGGGSGGGSHQPSILSFFRPRNQGLPATQPPPASSSTSSISKTAAAHPPPPPPLPQHHHQPPPHAAVPAGLPTRPDSAAVAAAGAAAAAVAAVSGPECRAPESWPTPHPQAAVAPVAEAHVTPLRRINSLLLCVNYPDSFYARVLDPAGSGLFSRVILWSDEGEPPKVIGSLIARLEPSPFTAGEDNNTQQQNGRQQQQQQQRRYALYIQSLTLLSPFRSLGLAASALDAVVAHAEAVNSPGGAAAAAGWRISDLFAHVWTDNEDGLRWYAARGFARAAGEPVKGYYLKLRPDTAWVVRRPLGGVAAAIAAAAAAAAAAPPPPPPPSAAAEPPPAPPAGAAAAARRPSPLSTKAPTAAGSASGTTTPASAQALCFQDRRPNMDWNDLPADVVAAAAERAAAATTPGLLDVPAPAGEDGGASHTSSRSSSTARKKRKDRSYPAAAFGS